MYFHFEDGVFKTNRGGVPVGELDNSNKAHKNYINRLYEDLCSFGLIVERKNIGKACKLILDYFYPNPHISMFENERGQYISSPSIFGISEKLSEIYLLLNDAGYIKNITNKDIPLIKDAFRLEVLSRLMNTNSIGFADLMFLFKELSNKVNYKDLFFIEVNHGPTTKTNRILMGYGSLLDVHLFTDADKESIIDEFRNVLSLKTTDLTAFDNFVVSLFERNLAENRLFQRAR